MSKFQNKYRNESSRLQTWNYTNDGAYFITIYTHQREHFFGEIIYNKMQLSRIGVIADIMWHEIKHHSKNIELGEFIVMPNHIHGILILNNNREFVGTGHALSLQHALPLPNNPPQPPNPKTIGHNRFQNPGKNSISSIVGAYKSAVSKHTHRLGFEFRWQSRFYDVIIRDEKSFENISNYIAQNPEKWEIDNFHLNS